MNRFVGLLSLYFAFLAQTAFAYLHPLPGSWGGAGEFIYFLPSIDDTYFVIESGAPSTGPSGTRRNNDFGFNPGFRVEGAYTFCSCEREFHVSYLRLRSHVNKTVTGSNLWATLGSGTFVDLFADYAGEALSDNDLLYQRVDSFFSQKLLDCCGLDLFLYAGLEYAYIRIVEDIDYIRTDGIGIGFGNVNQRSHVWGIGPEFGAEFIYNLCCINWCYPGDLSLTGSVTGSLLVSKSRINSTNFTPVSTDINVRDRNTWRVIPSGRCRFGLNYALCLPCFGASIEAGYEINSYVRAVNWQAFPDPTAPTSGLCYTAYKNFDAHGLYVNVGFTY